MVPYAVRSLTIAGLVAGLAILGMLAGCSDPATSSRQLDQAGNQLSKLGSSGEISQGGNLPAALSADRLVQVTDSANAFCGNCHAMPKPSSFSQKHWNREVQRGFDFYFSSGRADLAVPKASEIKQYFIQHAPVEMEMPAAVALDGQAVNRFEFSRITLPVVAKAVAMSSVSSVDLGGEWGKQLVTADMRGGSVFLINGEQPSSQSPVAIAQLQNPSRIHACALDDGQPTGLLVADLGSFLPADHQAGRVVWLRPSQADPKTFETEVLLAGCGRVADVQAQDIDGDGDLDIVVADFGWHETGQLSWLERFAPGPATADKFVQHVLDDRPGALETYAADINGDGRADIVSLIAQEFEAVVAYLNQGSGKFERQVLFAADDPAFGSSGMHWHDMDKDGDVDCLLTNGDSFDSFEVKPYHSIHWLENQGNLSFKDHEIMRLPGVHEALACDLDNDQDMDIVAAAFLPRDLISALPKQSAVAIVWLENDGAQHFKPRPLQVGTCLHPAICVADLNRDGRLDVAAANFYEDEAVPKPAIDLLIQH